jgi:antitoxin Phd
MANWSVQDAKAKFSEFLDTCMSEGPQIVTKRGAITAVLVPAKQWERMQQAARPSLKDLLLSNDARFDMNIPERHKLMFRTPTQFED